MGRVILGRVVLGADVCYSPLHGLYVNSLLSLSAKPKVEIESRSTLEKMKVLNIYVCFDKISIVSSQTRETF